MIGSNYKIIKNTHWVKIIDQKNGIEKICFTRNHNEIKEILRKDGQILSTFNKVMDLCGEVEDMVYAGSIILGLLTTYITYFAKRANESDHLESMMEINETIKEFGEYLPIINNTFIFQQQKEIQRWISHKKKEEELNSNKGLGE